MKIYTKSGDKGTTSLIGGNRIEKDSIRVEAYGTIDELNSYIGLCYHYLKNEDRDALRKIQTKLFDAGAELSSLNYKRLKTILTSEDVEELEKLGCFNNENIIEPLDACFKYENGEGGLSQLKKYKPSLALK